MNDEQNGDWMEVEGGYIMRSSFPQMSNWRCQIGGPLGLGWTAPVGSVPNAFNRMMQRLLLGITWTRKDEA